MVFDLASLKSILFLLDHKFILLISIFEKFSASPLVIKRRSSAKAVVVVRSVKIRFRIELYWMFHRPGQDNEPCEHPLLTS